MTTQTATATKTKRTLLRSECLTPPREIRENTKARRAWLAERLAEIVARPNRDAKIVGTGGYQSISVYEVKEVEGRLRFRGSCQFCGSSQVVDGGVLVLHGYTRPGDGQVWGQCPGMGLAPLNLDKSATEKWLSESIKAVSIATAVLVDAEALQATTSQSFHSSMEAAEAYKFKPRKPATWTYQTPEAKKVYTVALDQWAISYPLCAAYNQAQRQYEAARQAKWGAEESQRHFQYLINSNTHGTELTREVVA